MYYTSYLYKDFYTGRVAAGLLIGSGFGLRDSIVRDRASLLLALARTINNI